MLLCALLLVLVSAPVWLMSQQLPDAPAPPAPPIADAKAIAHPAINASTAPESGVAEEAAPESPPDVLAVEPTELPRAAAEIEFPVTVEGRERKPGHLDSRYDVNKIGDRPVGKGLDFYSYEREQELGRQLAEDVERDSRLLRDEQITEYVNRIGQRLARNSDARVPFTIKVIDNDEVNAFALPGGFFYVNTGLVLAADNEAQLAGVMAHEIAHVAARHATRNATRSQLFNLASIPLIFFGGPVGYAVRQAVALAVPMSFMKFSRDAEREADMLGLEYQYATGYDPQEFVRFFEKLRLDEKHKKHNFLAKAFATHPMTGDRIRRAQEEIAEYLPAKDDYVVDTSEFEAVKARLEALTQTRAIDGGQGLHPTLRRRQPEPKAKDDGPPKLERKN